jgi:monoamine oxidase
MARTRVFDRLRKWAQEAKASSHNSQARSAGITRRDFVRGASATVVGLGLSRSLTGCAEGPSGKGLHTVAVIGGGVAGLHCAYRLMQAGVVVQVFEASSRVGGRMFTARGMFPDDQVAELGGELVDTNHRFIRALVDEFGLALDDRLYDTSDELLADTWYVAGKHVSDATLVEQFKAVAPDLLAALESADSDDDAFAALDNTSLADFLDQTVPAKTYPELNAVLVSAYRGEFGLECEEQSALNLIYLIGSDDPDPFRIFGESDERYHIHGGNDQVTTALADALGDMVQTEQRLTAARSTKEGYEITLEDSDGATQMLTFGRLVFALPFTTLRLVDLSELGLSKGKLGMIEELGYGTNAKIMGAFSSRIWRTEHGAIGSITSDLPLQQTWDTSIGQDGESGLLTNFVGGERGVESGKGSAEAWLTGILPDLDAIYPGAAAAYVPDSAVRMHWPSYEFTRGSYTCYRPGQWSFWTLEGQREGGVHFCGEHTSPEFQGWMEGGAETGGRVAKEILDDLKLALPAQLAAVLDDDALSVANSARSLGHFPARFARLSARGR